MAERSSALNSSSGVVRMWVRIPAWPVALLVSLSKTLNHNCFVLRMKQSCRSRVLCNACKRTQDTYRKREGGLPRCFWIRTLSTRQGGYVRATNLLYYYCYFCRPVKYMEPDQISQTQSMVAKRGLTNLCEKSFKNTGTAEFQLIQQFGPQRKFRKNADMWVWSDAVETRNQRLFLGGVLSMSMGTLCCAWSHL